MALTGWRELRAYVEAESNYFVAKGVSLSPTWNVSSRISLAIAASYEDQKYVASDQSIAASSQRHDSLHSEQATLTYAPRDFFAAVVSFQRSSRSSTLKQFEFDDQLIQVVFSASF